MATEQINNRIVQVDLSKTFTKAVYARKIGKSQTWVSQMIKDGDLRTTKICKVTFVVID